MTTSPIRSAHRLLAARSFYPLAASSALACGTLAARFVLSDSTGFAFLAWNLVLAWTPYLLSLWTEALYRRSSRRWSVALTALAWLLFFPNAPYIVTDFLHLRWADGVPLWYDVGLIASFAWSGCFLAAASLEVMRRIVADAAGRATAWLFVGGVAVLSGLGVYLGRFGRYNSWDVFVAPHAILLDVLVALTDEATFRRAAGVTGLFAALLIVSYLMFAGARGGRAAGSYEP